MYLTFMIIYNKDLSNLYYYIYICDLEYNLLKIIIN